jgi:Mg/Co/Ni transporter MgtE
MKLKKKSILKKFQSKKIKIIIMNIKFDRKSKIKEDEIMKKLKIILDKTNNNKKKWVSNLIGKKT